MKCSPSKIDPPMPVSERIPARRRSRRRPALRSSENQLISVTAVAPASGDLKADFAYDWRMRRIAKKTFVYGASGWAHQKTTRYKYREWTPIEETIADASGTITEVKRYVWGNDLSGNMDGASGVGGLLSMLVLSTATSPLSPDVYFHELSECECISDITLIIHGAPGQTGQKASDEYGQTGPLIDGNMNEVFTDPWGLSHPDFEKYRNAKSLLTEMKNHLCNGANVHMISCSAGQDKHLDAIIKSKIGDDEIIDPLPEMDVHFKDGTYYPYSRQK